MGVGEGQNRKTEEDYMRTAADLAPFCSVSRSNVLVHKMEMQRREDEGMLQGHVWRLEG